MIRMMIMITQKQQQQQQQQLEIRFGNNSIILLKGEKHFMTFYPG